MIFPGKQTIPLPLFSLWVHEAIYLDIEHVYVQIRNKARQIVRRLSPPDFYRDFPQANALSALFFKTNPVILQLRKTVENNLKNNMGHGVDHAMKVSLDAGTLVIVEGRKAGYSEAFIQRRLLTVQCAGLLHDAKRRYKDHAAEGALFAKEILKHFPLTPSEIEDVSIAIRNHEAFKKTIRVDTVEGMILSDCLYDADKFRWGPDNFTDTVWAMLISSRTPLSQFIAVYPKGMEKIDAIRYTFRSDTAKRYGPQFIDLGLDIGRELYDFILEAFGGEL